MAVAARGWPRWWIRGVDAWQRQLDLANPAGFYPDDACISNANATGLPLFDREQVETGPYEAPPSVGSQRKLNWSVAP